MEWCKHKYIFVEWPYTYVPYLCIVDVVFRQGFLHNKLYIAQNCHHLKQEAYHETYPQLYELHEMFQIISIIYYGICYDRQKPIPTHCIQ